MGILEKLFRLKKHKSSFRMELIAGATTFLTMAYIAFVNPHILGVTGMDNSALIAVTCLVTAISTMAVGMLTNTPIAMAPGMGLNAFFAYSLVLAGIVNWGDYSLLMPRLLCSGLQWVLLLLPLILNQPLV